MARQAGSTVSGPDKRGEFTVHPPKGAVSGTPISGATVKDMLSIGGKAWKKGNDHRIYFENVLPLAGISEKHESGKLNRSDYNRMRSHANHSSFYYDVNKKDYVMKVSGIGGASPSYEKDEVASLKKWAIQGINSKKDRVL